jgi:hypothetical protein
MFYTDIEILPRNNDDIQRTSKTGSRNTKLHTEFLQMRVTK